MEGKVGVVVGEIAYKAISMKESARGATTPAPGDHESQSISRVRFTESTRNDTWIASTIN